MSNRQLPTFCNKTSAAAIRPELSVYCSPHDLIAIVTAESDVVVYRLNGQIAFTIKCKDPGEVSVTAAQWKPDGYLLALGWSDGSWGVYDGGSGKIVGQGRIGAQAEEEEWKLDLEPGWGADEDENAAAVTGISWEEHDVKDVLQAKVGRLPDGAGKSFGTEDWAEGLEDLHLESSGANKGANTGAGVPAETTSLPRSIMTSDPTRVLPRLSAIPSHGLRSGPDGARFATQATTDAVLGLRAGKKYGTLDVMVVYTARGDTQVLIDQTVQIGSSALMASPLRHASNPKGGSHGIVSGSENGPFQVHVQNLPLAKLSGPLLHVVARDTKRVQSLLAYITNTIRCIGHDLTTGLQFPTRLINNINMMLSEAEQPQGNLTYNLSHLLMTGQFSPIMLEWLTDIVREPNHKRWDQAIGGMYSHIQNHIFVNLLPALDRLSIAICSLRGQAKLHQDSTVFDVDAAIFNKILDGVDALRVIAQRVQLVCIEEWQQFRAFSKWLRVHIEIGTAGPFSKSALETEEKEAISIDHGLVLKYIKGAMDQSQLVQHVQKLPDLKGSLSKADFLAHAVVTSTGYKQAKEGLGFTADTTSINTAERLAVNLPAITVSLSGQIRRAIDQITKWQSRMLTPMAAVATVNDLSECAKPRDIRMDVGHGGEAIISMLVVAGNRVQRYQCRGNTGAFEASTIVHTQGSTYLDAKFESETGYVALSRSDQDGSHRLLRIDGELRPVTGTESNGRALDPDDLVMHTFAPETFKPETLLVGGRKHKETCAVFGNDGKAWAILDLSGQYRQVSPGTPDELPGDDDDVQMAG